MRAFCFALIASSASLALAAEAPTQRIYSFKTPADIKTVLQRLGVLVDMRCPPSVRQHNPNPSRRRATTYQGDVGLADRRSLAAFWANHTANRSDSAVGLGSLCRSTWWPISCRSTVSR